jgi:hypothetical protein
MEDDYDYSMTGGTAETNVFEIWIKREIKTHKQTLKDLEATKNENSNYWVVTYLELQILERCYKVYEGGKRR